MKLLKDRLQANFTVRNTDSITNVYIDPIPLLHKDFVCKSLEDVTFCTVPIHRDPCSSSIVHP